MEFFPVAHMDQVLKHALALKDPDGFMTALQQPLVLPDIRHIEAATAEVLSEEPAGEGTAEATVGAAVLQ
jgi:hypothetical protein